jgi:putative methanogenesis marker protein 6
MSGNAQDIITKIIVIASDSILPIDAAMAIYESENEITIKETCYGTMVSGPRDAVNRVVKKVVSMDENHIFVKERGFPPGDDRRCRAGRGGGPRPGFHFLREEVRMLPMIGKALDDYEKHVPLEKVTHPGKLEVSQLKRIIESELTR